MNIYIYMYINIYTYHGPVAVRGHGCAWRAVEGFVFVWIPGHGVLVCVCVWKNETFNRTPNKNETAHPVAVRGHGRAWRAVEGLGFGVWGLRFGVWCSEFGAWCWTCLACGCRFRFFLDFGSWVLDFGVEGLGFGVWGLGFGGSGLGFEVWGFGFGVSD